jgi:hypothetical protein
VPDREALHLWGRSTPIRDLESFMAEELDRGIRAPIDASLFRGYGAPDPLETLRRVTTGVSGAAIGDALNEAFRKLNDSVRRVSASMALFGLQVYVSRSLPTPPPSPGEDARRIVRHGMADVLKWLGEDVGPKPGEVTHAVVTEGMLVCSPDFEYAIRREYDPLDRRIPDSASALRLVSQARRRSQFDYGAPANIDLPVDAL